MSEIRQQIHNLTEAIEEAIEDWQLAMDDWSQEPAHRAGEMPTFGESFWDRLHSLRGLDPEKAEQYDWVLGLGY